eukprot:1393853-Rhodomonas_salina.4
MHLRARYAMSGTNMAYGATRELLVRAGPTAVSKISQVLSAMGLCACYEMPGTNAAYGGGTRV